MADADALPALYTCLNSRGVRASWAAEEAGTGIDLKMLPFPPRRLAPEYLDLNPLGTIPFLVDGDVEMSESCAIAVYLASRNGPSPLVIAAGERDYAAFLDYTYHADATLTFPQTVFLRFARFEKDRGFEEAGQSYGRWFHKRLVKVERRLESREFLCADRFTVADICVGYALVLAKSVGLDDGIPQSLRDYRDRLIARPAYLRAVEREKVQALAVGAIAPKLAE